jgi:hypothetical protein
MRNALLGILGLVVAIVGVVTAITTPEIRCMVGLDNCTPTPSDAGDTSSSVDNRGLEADDLSILEFYKTSNAFVVVYANPDGVDLRRYRFNGESGAWGRFGAGWVEEIGPNLFQATDNTVKPGIEYCYLIQVYHGEGQIEVGEAGEEFVRTCGTF